MYDLALCLGYATTSMEFGLKLKLMLCLSAHIFGRGQNQGGQEVSERAGGVV